MYPKTSELQNCSASKKMPTDPQREEYVKWLNLELARLCLEPIYSSYLVSMLEQGGDAGFYLRTVMNEIGTIAPNDIEALVSEVSQRWYRYDDDDEIISLTQGYSPADFIDEEDDDNFHEERSRIDSSTAGSLTPVLAPSYAVRPVLTPVSPWLSQPEETNKTDIFGTQLSFDVVGLSATAKEFTPGSVGSEEFKYLNGDGVNEFRRYTQMSSHSIDNGPKSFDINENGYVTQVESLSSKTNGNYYNGKQFSSLREELFGLPDDEEYEEIYENQDLETEMTNYLSSSFPECGQECMLLALRKADFDMELASEIIANAFAKGNEKNHKQPCRHFLSGECLRKDCMFSHDFASTVCRYWLQGACRNGDNCLFVHDLDAIETNYASSPVSFDAGFGSKDIMMSSKSSAFQGMLPEEFPALGISPPKSQSFPKSPVMFSFPREGVNNSNSMLSPAGKSFASVVGTTPPTQSFMRNNEQRNINKRKVNNVMTSWVPTGEIVSEQYRQARGEAAELARDRNSYFMGATKAYRKGNAREAKILAEKGRELNKQMKEQHRTAARCIYEARNPRKQVLERGTLDLHGLHVAEATALLEDELPQLCQAGLRNVYLVTGTGHHSKGTSYKARLLPAVEKFCYELGLCYEKVTDKNGHIGMLYVTLSKDVLLSNGSGACNNVNGEKVETHRESPQRTIIIR
mmetsp:Transcript_3130/g.4813  ORF Transcript_3130/g.4813 Transcript_3130/m.4813 type:complete len:689 (-) Transcript_3130:104-2170(-)